MAGVKYGQISSQGQIRSVVSTLGLYVKQSTIHDYLVLCPFHYNNHSPSLSISKENGTYICFNPSCGAQGDILSLVMKVKKFNQFEALRFLAKHETEVDIHSEIVKNLVVEDDFTEFSQELVDRLHADLSGDGLDYMIDRGFSEETLDYFKIGYSKRNEMITIPIYNHRDLLVGQIGRHIHKKVFKNSTGLPGSKVMYNLNNAKKYEVAIVVESSLDTMMLHQRSFPSSIATMGGYISPFKMQLMNRYFNDIIIATDNDEAGRALGEQIAEGFYGTVRWASPLFTAKDICEMNHQDTEYAIRNAVSAIEFVV